MRSMWNTLKQKLFGLLRYLWGYSGTLAMLSLMLGVLGMGVYHLIVKDIGEEYRHLRTVRHYSGLYNTAGPEPPRGLGPVNAAGDSPCIHFEYNEAGQPTRVVCMGADGLVQLLPGSRVAEQLVEYDENGRVVAKHNKDAAGHPAADAHGVASREFVYNDSGMLVSSVAKDASGKKIVPRMPGYAEQQVYYDAHNRPTEVRHLDGTGKPITNAAGENTVRYQYDDAHQLTTRSNYENGVLHGNKQGVAVKKTHATSDGLIRHSQHFSDKGEPAQNTADGEVARLVELSPSGRIKRVRRCGQDGLPLQQSRSCSEHVLRSNAAGLPEWECFNGADGHPCDNPALGYAEHVWEYDDAGALAREYFWDAAGNPAPVYEKRYSGQGAFRHVLSLHTDGSTELRRCDE